MGGRCCQGLPVALQAGRGVAQGEQDGAQLDQAQQAGRVQVDGSPICLHQSAGRRVASYRIRTGLNVRSTGSWAGGTANLADDSQCDAVGVLAVGIAQPVQPRHKQCCSSLLCIFRDDLLALVPCIDDAPAIVSDTAAL